MRVEGPFGTLKKKYTAGEDGIPVTHLTARYLDALSPNQRADLMLRWMRGETVIIQGRDDIDRPINQHLSLIP